jgi:hypothetical protein
MTRPFKPTKGQKVVTDENGKTRLVPDFEKQRRQKPAGQQRWNSKKVRVKPR